MARKERRRKNSGLRLAEQACRLTSYKEATPLGTLAAAYAEAGRFNDAATAAQKAIELATATGNTGFANINQQLLRLYQAGKPYHMPPPPAARPQGQ